jgi:nitrite reductase/ring-hydroxylating ferredoxin subunit
MPSWAAQRCADLHRHVARTLSPTVMSHQRSLSNMRVLPDVLEEELLAASPPVATNVTLAVPASDGGAARPRLLSLVVLRDASGVTRAFENYCPHQGGTLFLAPDGLLTCRLHGAQFRLCDGLCTSGPCAGQRLYELPVEADVDSGVRASLSALVGLRDVGSGGRAAPAKWKPSATIRKVLEAFDEQRG